MEIFENEKITIKKDGQEIECDVLCTFNCVENERSYILYTDHSKNEKGEENIYAVSFDPIFDTSDLRNVEEPEELAMIEDVIAQIRRG